MSRTLSAVVATTLAALACQVAVAESPVIHNLYDPDPVVDMPTSVEYLDIPGTEKTVTVPDGTAFITWAVAGHLESGPSSGAMARLRPIVGESSPLEGQVFNRSETALGSWMTSTTSGTITVRLQIGVSNGDGTERFIMVPPPQRRDMVSWSMVVFPTEAKTAPAVSTIGLLVLSLSLLVGIMVKFGKRRPKHQAA